MTLGRTVEQWARERPGDCALRYEHRHISWLDLNKSVNRLANGLRNLGIGKGDRVAIMLPNTPEFVFTFYACRKLGAVAVPFNTMYKGNEIGHVLRDSGARAIVCLTNFVPLINELRSALPDLQHVITTGERSLTLADPDSTIFVQAVIAKSVFGDVDTAYRRTGEALLQALAGLGIHGAWYRHQGSIRIGGKKLAGCIVSELEDIYIINTLCFVAPFDPSDFFSVLWVPPEVKDKALEPIMSMHEIIGARPSDQEIITAIRESFSRAFGVTFDEGSLTREEQFGYVKQRALVTRRPQSPAAPRQHSEGLLGKLVRRFSRRR